jgi:hypothetical protein
MTFDYGEPSALGRRRNFDVSLLSTATKSSTPSRWWVYEVVVVFAAVHKLQQLDDGVLLGNVDEVLLARVAKKFLTLPSGL